MMASFAKSYYQQGFTLIEVMITITILGILLAIGIPLTSAWIDRSKTDNAAASLKTAILDARVAALRNANNQLASVAASCVLIDSSDNNIKVILLANGATPSCTVSGNQLLKATPYASGVTFQQSSTNITGNCFAFNSNGILDATTCATSLNTITVGKNNETADVSVL